MSDPAPINFATLDIDTYNQFPWMVIRSHRGHSFFQKCLIASNPHAIYLEAIWLAFKEFELDEALDMLEEIKHSHPTGSLLYLLLGYCAGFSDAESYIWLFSEFGSEGIEEMGRTIIWHVEALTPTRQNTFASTFSCDDVPVEDCAHPDDKYCLECIFYRLGLKICALT